MKFKTKHQYEFYVIHHNGRFLKYKYRRSKPGILCYSTTGLKGCSLQSLDKKEPMIAQLEEFRKTFSRRARCEKEKEHKKKMRDFFKNCTIGKLKSIVIQTVEVTYMGTSN